jgi:MFS family permease
MGKWNFATLIACAGFSLIVEQMERHSDDRKPISDRLLLTVIVVFVLSSLFCASRILADWGVAFFLFGRATISMSIPVTQELVGRFATRENRVAVLSAYGSALRFLLAVACVPIAAALREKDALPTVLWWIAVTSTVALGFALFLVIAGWRHIPERHEDPDEIDDPTQEPAFAAEVMH